MNLVALYGKKWGALLSIISCLTLWPFAVFADSIFPVHYLVVAESPDGHLSVLSHQIVAMQGNPDALAVRRRDSRLERVLAADVLEKSSGKELFASSAVTSPWLRGEFHGSGRIDGHLFPIGSKEYVVRVPVMANTMLRLHSQLPRQGDAAPGAMLEVDLDSFTRADARPAALPAGYASGHLISNGDSANRLDLLIVAEGYTAAEQAQFLEHARTLANNFLAISPYSDFSHLINVTYLFVPSNQSGADKPNCPETPGSPVVMVDTAFDATFCAFSTRRLVTVDTGKVLAAAANVPDWDKVMVLVNDTEYGGSGGNVGVVTNDPYAAEIMQHEFGHSFTLLADEYDDPYPGYPACSDRGGAVACEANVTDVNTRTALKWARWVDPATPIPTVDALSDLRGAGLWEGARYQPTGMYRQCNFGMMRYLGTWFCKVDSEAFVKRLYEGAWGVPAQGVSLIEPNALPAGSEVSAPAQTSVQFQATLAGSRVIDALQVAWYVDGALVAQTNSTNGEQVTYSYSVPDTGSHTVELRVSDTTPFLLDPAVRSRQWTVRGLPAGSCAISSSGYSVSARGGNGSVAISGGSACNWTATSQVNWIAVTSGASGSGSGTVGFTVAANGSTQARSGALSIAGLSYTVSQSGAALPGVPTQIRLVPGHGSMIVHFAPPDSDGGVDINGYTVTCVGEGRTFTAQGTASPITVSGLSNGVSYSCSVSASNVIGRGGESTPVSKVLRVVGNVPVLLLLLD